MTESEKMMLRTLSRVAGELLKNDNDTTATCDDCCGDDCLPEISQIFGVLNAFSANSVVKQAMETPDPECLWKNLWYEGEICCLFSDTNLGKSIYAVQIAESIAQRHPEQAVALFDLELSQKQFQLRYTDGEKQYKFPKNFYRCELVQYQSVTEDMILDSIERFIVEKQCKIIILDNITWLCNQSDRGNAAGNLMMSLATLKLKYNLSLLVIAHTPKRKEYLPLSINDLAGSRKLANFFDSVFAIGKVLDKKNERYVIQLKCRTSTFTYGKDNVLHYEIVKDDAFTHFRYIGTIPETLLIRKETIEESALRMLREGMSVQDISVAVGKSVKTIYRWFPKKDGDRLFVPQKASLSAVAEDLKIFIEETIASTGCGAFYATITDLAIEPTLRKYTATEISNALRFELGYTSCPQMRFKDRYGTPRNGTPYKFGEFHNTTKEQDEP